MEIPDPSKWMKLSEAALKLGTSYKVLHRLATVGRISNGQRVKLVTWQTVRGRVTSIDELRRFHERINQEK